MFLWQCSRVPAVVLAFVFGLCPHLPAQTSTDANSNLWPFQVGNTWTVQTPVKDKLIVQVITVTTVTPGKDSSTATLESRSGSTSLQTETYRFNSQGISRLTSGVNGSSKIYPGLPILQYPLLPHSTWFWNGTITTKGRPAQAEAKMTAAGPESVKIPAGTFQAWRVHVDLVILAGKRRVTIPNDYWFAPGVGLIRQTATIGKTTIDSKLTQYKVQPAPSHP